MQAFSVLPLLRLACGLLGRKFRAVVPHGNTMHTRPVTVPVPLCSSSVSLRRNAMQSGDSLSFQRFRLRWRLVSLWRLLLLEHPMRDSWLPSISGDPLLCNSSLTSILVSVAAPWLYLSHSEADKRAGRDWEQVHFHELTQSRSILFLACDPRCLPLRPNAPLSFT